MKRYADSEKELVEVTPEGAERRMLSYGGGLMAVRFDFDAGVRTIVHSHPHEQIGYVVSGELELFVSSEPARYLTPGCSYYIPPHVPHCVRTETPAVVLDCFSPPRDDFLKQRLDEQTT